MRCGTSIPEFFAARRATTSQYGYRDIRVTYNWTIPPSALLVLAGDDQFDGAIELASNGRRTGLPVQFRQRDSSNAVRVGIY